ncbi:nucleotidyl transferase AbiEii/AbiGii toxin family protein [Pendulispora rubella]|uniref:Nucleotidyl transferase AbiEii/AbiGii toxin family protein n=1 Tax=Pendulispora rubella TaxID=2741070 RepID=A0ABZ2L929_9BACT
MTEFTRPATWDDLKLLASYLTEAGVKYALIGGYAIAAHGLNRFSEDIDILVDPSPDNTRRWIEALAKLPDGAAGELRGEDDIFQREGPYAIRINDEFTVDVMAGACGHSWQELERYITEVDLDGVKLRVLGLDGLLLTKEGMRERDRADAQVLRQVLGKAQR